MITSKYEKLNAYELEKIIERNLDKSVFFEKEDIVYMLLLFCNNNINFKIAQKVCSKFIRHEDPDIVNLAITCVGHVARVYKRLVNKKLVNNIVDICMNEDHELFSAAEETLSDMKIFLKKDLYPVKLLTKNQK